MYIYVYIYMQIYIYIYYIIYIIYISCFMATKPSEIGAGACWCKVMVRQCWKEASRYWPWMSLEPPPIAFLHIYI